MYSLYFNFAHIFTSNFRKAAAANGGIPEATVRDYYNMIYTRGGNPDQAKPKVVGRHVFMSKENEDKLAKHLIRCVDRGYPRNKM